MAARILTQNY